MPDEQSHFAIDKEFLYKSLKGDRVIWFIYGLLILISVIEVYSATSSLVYGKVFAGNIYGPIGRHMIYCGVGILVTYTIQLFDIRRLWRFFIAAYFLSLLMLVAVLVVGHSENDASRWLVIFGFPIQPSELAKIFYVATMAFLLSKLTGEYNEDKRQLKYILGITLVTCGLIGLENVSTAALVYLTGVLMCVVAQVKFKYYFWVTTILVGLVAALFLVAGTETAQKSSLFKGPLHRVMTMRGRLLRFGSSSGKSSKTFVVTEKNFQSVHGKIAIANSYGIGLGPGRSKERDVLPQAYSDFIFAIIIEETGLLGGGLVLLLYIALLYRIGKIMAASSSRFSANIVAGLGMLIAIQALINTGVAVGLLPVTGQPLPLISRGGTAGIIFSVYFGIFISISNYEGKSKKAAETATATDGSAPAEETGKVETETPQ